MNKKIITALSLSAFLFAACGSDDSSSANDNEKSSSSVAVEECDEDDCDEELDEKSSSSKKGGSESSDSKDDDNSSSSEKDDGKSSSSEKDEKSSSSSAEGPSVVSKGEVKDSRDGKVYKTVKIGAQTWMAENLAYKTADSKCSSGDSDCKNGRLYHWADVMDLGVAANTSSAALLIKSRNKGICPEGFHVPNKSDYERLFTQPWVDNVFRSYDERDNGWFGFIDYPTDAESLVFGSDSECKLILQVNSSYKESDLKSCNLYKFNGSFQKDRETGVRYWTAFENGDDKALGASLLNAKYVFDEAEYSAKSDLNYLRCVSDEERCGGKELQDNQYCYNDKVYEKAKPSEGACDELAAKDGLLKDRCYGPKDSEGLVAYSPVKFYAEGGMFYPLCGGKKLAAEQFCAAGKAYDKCGGRRYDFMREFCRENVVVAFCDSISDNQFCVDGIVYDKCGGKEYDITKEKCINNVVNKICGPSYYVPGGNIRCLNDEIIELSYGELKDSRDGQTYKTIKIGTQTWMAENLNYTYTPSWCYDNKTSNCEKYGRLYTWSAVMDSAAQFSVNADTKCGYGKTCTPNSPHRGICPEGWHVPTNEEYGTLYTYIGGISTAENGALLRSTTGWKDYGNKNRNGIDSFGFSVLPAGRMDYGGKFTNEGADASLWTASEYEYSSNEYSLFQYFYYGNDRADMYNTKKNGARSLRCLKD
ncbi:MAG: hypothetical protein MJZ22_04485 [Candidatus Saccharibacteria bacterium]|nr:hypothetical protein [Candidatus Saccharibacteria bacterium]